MDLTPDPAPFEIPIDGELDLHTFAPRDLGLLLPEYLAQCRAKGILEVRVVHGKGTGVLKQSVHALLARMPEVASFRDDDPGRGGWGATLVTLRSLQEEAEGREGSGGRREE